MSIKRNIKSRKKRKRKILVSKYTITMLSIKDLVFEKQLAKKLIKRYIESYMIEKIILANIIKLKLLESMRIHLVVNISRVVKYRKLVKY